jgi:Bacterial protein of unknown function (HtrL_YibB)
METLLENECFLCIFGDAVTIPLIQEIRNRRFGLARLTHYILIDFENLWAYKYADRIRANRQTYHPTKTDRDSIESHIIQCNKFDFVLNTIRINPFRTSKFGWIDANVGVNGAKICQGYNKDILPSVLHSVTEKFHIQLLNVEDKALGHPDRLREYYERYRWVACGCLFTMGAAIGVPILNRLKEVFIETTMLGYGHAEEPLFIGVLDEFYDSFERSYGDYYNILNNFTRHTRGFQYICTNLLERYMNFGYFREAYDCSKKLIADFEVGDANNSLRFHIHYRHLLCATEYKKEEVGPILRAIKQGIVSGAYKEEFLKERATYLEKFRACSVIAKSTRRRSGANRPKNTRRKPAPTVIQQPAVNPS